MIIIVALPNDNRIESVLSEYYGNCSIHKYPERNIAPHEMMEFIETTKSDVIVTHDIELLCAVYLRCLEDKEFEKELIVKVFRPNKEKVIEYHGDEFLIGFEHHDIRYYRDKKTPFELYIRRMKDSYK